MKAIGTDFSSRFKTGDILRHFKRDADGKGTKHLYVYIGIARHSETSERLAVYKALYGDGILYVRPEESFFGRVDKERHPEARQEFRFESADAGDLDAVKKAADIE